MYRESESSGSRKITSLKDNAAYTYFPKSEWPQILRGEENDEEGKKIRERYAQIYREKFLGETQDSEKNFEVIGTSGCRTNPKDAFRLSPRRISRDELEILTMTA